jgi:hypothetical protein
MVLVFLFAWSIVLLIDIQRSEMLSLDKLLQLPMTLKSAFVLNYLTSFVSVAFVTFLASAMGLALAFALTFGPHMLILPLVVCSFLFMVTALTYQLRGWLASLMSNKRRQRSVVATITLGFVAMTQVPNIILQVSIPNKNQSRLAQQAELDELSAKLTRQEVSVDEHNQQVKELNERYDRQRSEESARTRSLMAKYLTLANQIVPIGWLPLSCQALMNNNFLVAGLCLLGTTTIGWLSIWRGYITTLRYYTGSATKRVRPAVGTKRLQPTALATCRLARKIPFLSEQSTAVALCSFYNFTRAPEAKMMLIAPLVFGVLAIIMTTTKRFPKFPVGTEPFLLIAGLGVVLFILMTLVMNTFGFDRHGFRCYVLMPVERREILIGKNFGIAPFVVVMVIFLIAISTLLVRTSLLSVLATVLQAVTMFFASALVGNLTSIYFPQAMAHGTGKPAQPNLKSVVVQIAALSLTPLVLIPGALAIGADWLLSHYFNTHFTPVFFLVSFIEASAMGWFYFKLIEVQGKLLAARETVMLQSLTANQE